MGRRKKVKKIYPTVEILNHLDLSKHFDLMRSQGLSQTPMPTGNIRVSPCSWCPIPIPAVEAMACGCPAIVSAESALPETCGDAALYCELGDTQQLVEHVLQLQGISLGAVRVTADLSRNTADGSAKGSSDTTSSHRKKSPLWGCKI